MLNGDKDNNQWAAGKRPVCLASALMTNQYSRQHRRPLKPLIINSHIG
jgi:hypothetical protein